MATSRLIFLQKISMVLNSLFDPMWLNADVALGNRSGAVLQKPLDKGDVVPVGLVNLCGVPLAEAVGADALKSQIVADNGELLLNCAFSDGENQVFSADAIPQTVILHILSDDKRDSEYAMLARLLLHDLKAEAVAIPNNVTGPEFDDVADPQPQISLQNKGGCDALIGAATTESRFHCLNDFLVLLCGESLSFLVHGDLQE